ncbi:guanylate cyclase [Paracidovorax avenae]|uniref:guanylate cyclase n=1 Tax=Paracidovorax avenae TaxID=80867 RepID=UPI000D1726B1|nr:guanylate cyclase [Paracidovorax avenae]AVS71739.1 guanylate cyclase [Paracidovorax avenae]
MPPLLDLTSPQLLAILRGRGLGAGMEALNANVAHRYTGVFRVDGPRLFNVHVYDKLGQARPEALAVVELADSFCQFVLRDGELLTENSLHEDKLAHSPFRGVVVAYHGVPIGDNAGGLWGTLCHFDYEERELTPAQYELLKAAGHMLYPFVRHLHGGRVPEAAPGAQAPSTSPLPLPSVS